MKSFVSAEHLLTITGHAGAIYDIKVVEGKVYSSSADHFVTRWNLSTGEQDKFAIKLPYSGFKIHVQNNIILIGNSKGGIHFVDLNNKKELRYMEQHKAAIFALNFNSKTNEFYSSDADGYFCVWDANNFDLKLTLPFSSGKIRKLTLSEDNNYLILCGQDGVVRILETNFYNEINNFKAHSSGVNTAIFYKNQIITGGKNAHISFWNAEDINNVKFIKTIPAHNYAVYELSIIRESIMASVSFDKTIKIWDIDNQSVLQRIDTKSKGHTHTVNALARIDENSFVTASDDRKIKIWKLN